MTAWVRLGVIPQHFVTAVSQDGTETSGFYLQYSSDKGRWAFARPDLRVASSSAPVAGAWTHLAGVCDSAAGELRLFVNGVQEGAVRDRILIVSEGPVVIGRGRYGRSPVDYFPGGIKDVARTRPACLGRGLVRADAIQRRRLSPRQHGQLTS
ncbi:LamG-like jellyroll fold domain-containing protein [Streptomyces sp. NPDC003719]